MGRKFIILCFASVVLWSCKPKIKEETFSKGEIDVSSFIMLGGAHSAGYMDDALYYEGQEYSLANLIASQLKKVGLPMFHQPWVNEGSVGIGITGQSFLYLGYKTDCKGVTALSPVRKSPFGDASILSESLYSSSQAFGNYGIPGLKLLDVAQQNYSSQNPYFSRMASTSSTSVLQDISATNASFFSVNLGIEDVMDFAKSGGTIENLPSQSAFQAAYFQVLEEMTANGAKGVVATIPDVTKMPYFTTIPWNGLTLDAASNTTLNSIYNPIGFYFNVGSNPFMIVDSTANLFAVRQILSDELLLLSVPLDSVKCNQMGVLFPLRDEFVLDQGEISILRAKINQYNEVIRNFATQFNLALVETGSFVEKLYDGYAYNGVTMSAKFVSGGAYSLDGVHFNPRGNALLANEFIQAINQKYKARIPMLNAGKYRAILFPN
jgi:hypothetical protein